MVLVGFALYLLNVAVGILAALGVRFGRGHHILYAVVLASALAATWAAFAAPLLLTVAALAVLPRTRPRGAWHPTVAMVGLLGYVLALLPGMP